MRSEIQVKWTLVFALTCLLWAGVLSGALAETYMVPMRDDVKLAADVFLPPGNGPWPTILHRTPYGRTASVLSFEAGTIPMFLDWGYAVVTQDWRGFGDSEGVMMPFLGEGWGEIQDGNDTVEWIANQNWSNGKIGGYGASMPGDAQNLLAGSYPPHLLCHVSYMACSDE
jgi:putative CocE/NonD family hydrolase